MFAILRLLPLAWKLGIAVALICAVVGAGAAIHHSIYQEGVDDNQAKVDAGNLKVINETDRNRLNVRNCDATHGMRWSQHLRECVRVEPGLP